MVFEIILVVTKTTAKTTTPTTIAMKTTTLTNVIELCDQWPLTYPSLPNLPTLSKEWSLTFDIRPTGVIAGWSVLFQATIGGSCCSIGTSIPGVWFVHGTSKIQVQSAVNGQGTYAFTSDSLELNVWSAVQVRQQLIDGQYIYSILINDTVVHTVENTTPETFENVQLHTKFSPFNKPVDVPQADICNYKLQNLPLASGMLFYVDNLLFI